MKKFLYHIMFLFTLIPGSAFPQLLFEENFSYSTGPLFDVSAGNWVKYSTGTRNIEVQEGNLSYPGYPSSGTGRYIFLEGVSNVQALQRYVNNIKTGSVYISFLVSVKDTLNLDNLGSSFFAFTDSTGHPKGYLYIKKASTPGFIKLGIRKGITSTFADLEILINETIVVVLKYKFIPQTINDSISLWINPPLTTEEPFPDVIDVNGADCLGIKGITLRPSSNSGNIYLDGIRFARTWAEAPLPVQLSSFNAVLRGDCILLRWKTETEVDNYGFDIERKITSVYLNEGWKKIGFLQGYGSCNAPKYYSFQDNELYNFTNYSYRLKQIDNMGAFTYSDEISLQIEKPGILELRQNYPNPFNPETVVRFSIPEDGIVNINLFNIIGQEVREVLSGYYNAGDHKITIDSENLPAGIYFCVLAWEKQRKIIKMTLSK